VIYASLGKSFEAGLSEDFIEIAREARAELLAIQGNFSQFEKFIQKAIKIQMEEKEGEDLETASNYDELDYDIKFLDVENQLKKEEVDNEEEDEEAELINEEVKVAETEEKKIHQLISSFEVSDAFIMSACELLFYHWNPGVNNKQKAKDFLKGSLGLNPANELKILDTILTVLYTPEFFESENWKNQSKAYEDAVGTILSFLTDYFNDVNRSYIFFVPKMYLEKFGNKILGNLKEKTNFSKKTSDCYTLFDMIVG